MKRRLIDILNEKKPGIDQKRPVPKLMIKLGYETEPTQLRHNPPETSPPTPDGNKPTVRPTSRKPSGPSY